MPPAARGLFSRKRETCPLDPRKSFCLTKSFVGGPGGRFFKRAPLAAGGIFFKLIPAGIYDTIFSHETASDFFKKIYFIPVFSGSGHVFNSLCPTGRTGGFVPNR